MRQRDLAAVVGGLLERVAWLLFEHGGAQAGVGDRGGQCEAGGAGADDQDVGVMGHRAIVGARASRGLDRHQPASVGGPDPRPGYDRGRRDSKPRCSRQNTNSSAPITMRVHHELKLPSNAIRVWMIPRISTPNKVPAT